VKIVVLFIAVISILPFPMLAFLYELIPNEIPLLFDFTGNPTAMISKSIFSVFRFPIMGLLLQVVCIIGYLLKYEDKKEMKLNRVLWLTMSVIPAMTRSAASLEVFIYGNEYLLNVFRNIRTITVIIAIGTFIITCSLLYKRQKSKDNEVLRKYYKAIDKWKINTAIIALIAYIFMYYLIPMIMLL